MIFKLLCFAFIACTFVQASQVGEWLSIPFDIAHKAGDAAHETIAENSESINEKKEAVLGAGKAIYHSGVDALGAVVNVLTTGPRIALKVVLKNVTNANSKSDDYDGIADSESTIKAVQNAAHETNNENAEIRNKAIDSMANAAEETSRAVGQTLATGWNILTSPLRFGSKLSKKVGEENEEESD